MNEKWSAWMDGEPCGTCGGQPGCTCGPLLIEALRADADARNDWFLAHLAGDALRGRPVLDDGFSVRIIARLDAIETDPAYDPLASEG